VSEQDCQQNTYLLIRFAEDFLLRREEVFAKRYPIRFAFREPAPRNHEKPKVFQAEPSTCAASLATNSAKDILVRTRNTT
jgi:hypothetical protein